MAKNECNNECSNECECSGECNNESETENNAEKKLSNVKNVIAVMSGKGGVGKSLVSGLTAMALRQQGFTVGIMDADITGPSIPTIFGTKERPVVTDKAMVPVQSKTGIKIMSINLLLQDENEAVIWRGPIIGKVIQQFWSDVLWGDLDYLIVDLPPGTADAPLTVLASLPVNGIIIVFTPQELTAMVVRKAINMAQSMNKKILGVVENMSYLHIPEINKKMEIFGKSRGKEMAAQIGAPLLAQIPLDPDLVKLCDKGEIEKYNSPAYKTFAENLVKVLKEDKPAKAD